jgi:hypothetical protein
MHAVLCNWGKPLDNGKVGAETCRGEAELETKVKQINKNTVNNLALFCYVDHTHGGE